MYCAWMSNAKTLDKYTAIFELIVYIFIILGIDNIGVGMYYCHKQFSIAEK